MAELSIIIAFEYLTSLSLPVLMPTNDPSLAEALAETQQDGG